MELEQKIRSLVRGPDDKVLRFKSGNTICVMASTDKYGVDNMIDRIRKNIKISLDFGISIYPDHAKTKDQLIELAEKNLGIGGGVG